MSWNSIFGGGTNGTAKDLNELSVKQTPGYELQGQYASRLNAPKDPIDYRDWRLQAIHMRMQRGDGTQLPFDGLETLLGDDLVYILIVVNGKGVMLEDDRGLFPSDTLLTQLRLLAK